VLAAVESGNVEAGFVYRTDARLSKHAKIIFEVPSMEGLKIIYPAAVLNVSKHPSTAAGFVAYLAESEARAVFEKYGFTNLP
jgi:molybdate transport system substrate-binding protein